MSIDPMRFSARPLELGGLRHIRGSSNLAKIGFAPNLFENKPGAYSRRSTCLEHGGPCM